MLATCLRLKLLWVLMFRPLSPGSVPTNGTTLIRVCGSGGTSWRTSTRWGTACGSQWAASCSRAPRSCRGRCPHAASAESGWYQLMFQSRFPNVHEHLQTDELHVKHEVIYITRSFINNGGQRGRPFLSGRLRHAVSRSEKSPPQPVSPSGCSTFRLLWSRCVIGTAVVDSGSAPKHVHMKLHPLCAAANQGGCGEEVGVDGCHRDTVR